jgi:hypothetical protein
LLSDLGKIRADIDSIFVMVNMRDGSGHWRSANMSLEEVIAGLECAKLEAIDKRLCGEEGT